ncbi:MAG TPA: cytochrome C oxidase assembly protein, partial [Porphyromonadaceae bacterium]|nr:cytochrome C oxidase assembly protein [Porphyromonadaceae bacterium]
MNDYIFLQHYWWFIISLLGGILVLLLFVQGGQSLLFTIGKTENEQKMLVNSTGRKWEFTFTTLVTFGGAFFASFPLFYSTSFGGAYWVWLLILLCFVLQAVSYEFQSKKGNLLGKKTYQIFLIINGVLGPILLGTAVGTFFNGAEFVVNKAQLTDISMPVISTWANPLHGLEAAFNIWNVCLGLAVFFLSRVLAILYFINNINDDAIRERCRKRLYIEAPLFLVFFLTFFVHTLITEGFAVDPVTGEVFMEKYKY